MFACKEVSFDGQRLNTAMAIDALSIGDEVALETSELKSLDGRYIITGRCQEIEGENITLHGIGIPNYKGVKVALIGVKADLSQRWVVVQNGGDGYLECSFMAFYGDKGAKLYDALS